MLFQLMTFNGFHGYIYADSAFVNRYPIVTPFHPAVNAAEAAFNTKMSSVRMSVEQGFKGSFHIISSYS